MSDSIGAGRYRLLDLLGAGGMATVHRAYDTRLDVERAIKILAPRLANNPTQRERFVNEARTMARLHHPNVVTVHDVDVDEGRAFMVMEILPGGSLVDRVTVAGPLPPRLAVDVVLGLLDGLEVAHEAGVVHRDIKPHNVLLDAKGTPKLTDFGIARVTTSDRSMTRTGAVMGTLAYMAPEQRLSSKDVDARADLYAVGCTLYALISGREPFDLHATELHDQTFAGIEPVLGERIKTATRARPDDRYPSAAAMRQALVEARSELPADPEGTEPLVTSLGASSSSEVVRAAHGLAPTPASEIGTGSGSTGPGPHGSASTTAGATFAFDAAAHTTAPVTAAPSGTAPPDTLSDDGGTLPDTRAASAPPARSAKAGSGLFGFFAVVGVALFGAFVVAAIAVAGAGGLGALFVSRQSQQEAAKAKAQQALLEEKVREEQAERERAEAESERARSEARAAEASRREAESSASVRATPPPPAAPTPEPADTALVAEDVERALEELEDLGAAVDDEVGPFLNGPFGVVNRPPATMYTLSIETRPAGIEVCANPGTNRQCITTPGALELRPGLHPLVVSDPRGGKIRKVVTIRDRDIDRCFLLPSGRPCD